MLCENRVGNTENGNTEKGTTTMKTGKKFISILLTLVLLLSMTLPAYAMEEVPNRGEILIRSSRTVDASQKHFVAYKILDLRAWAEEDGDPLAYQYSVPAKLADFYASYYDLDRMASDFDAKVQENLKEEDISAILEAVSGTSPYFSGVSVADGYAIKALPLGYYIVCDKTTNGTSAYPVCRNMLVRVAGYCEINLSEIPTIERFAVDLDRDPNTAYDRCGSDVAYMGDAVTYVLETRIPEMTGYEKYFFTANFCMSEGLTYTNNMEVRLWNDTLTEGEDYEVIRTDGKDSSTELQIRFLNFARYNSPEYTDLPISISYTAVLNAMADTDMVPNSNYAYLEYSQDPFAMYEGENYPTEEDLAEYSALGTTYDEMVEVYTGGVEIIATDPNGNRLDGAEFALHGEYINLVRAEYDVYEIDEAGPYWKLINGAYTTVSPDAVIDGAMVDKSLYDSITIKYTKQVVTEILSAHEDGEITATVGQDGVLRLKGIGIGDYVITNTKVPEGYNPMTEGADLSISRNEETGELEYEGTVREVDGKACVYMSFWPGSAPAPDPEIDETLILRHSLNLAEDISIHYIVPQMLLEGYDMDTVVLTVEIPEYEGNTWTDSAWVTLSPEVRDGLCYFTLRGLTAVQMGDVLSAVLRGQKDNVSYVSPTDHYCVATYAMSQLNNPDAPAKLKTLCADLLRYGAATQRFKGYRTAAPADASMTPEHRAYLTELDTVIYGDHGLEISNGPAPSFAWVGKSLNLESRVALTFRFRQTDPTLRDEEWKVVVQYRNSQGEQIIYETDSSELTQILMGDTAVYEFTFSELAAAELRNAVCVTIYNGDNEPISPDLIYSADTYGNGKTGALGEVCKALFAYSDSAKAFFAG